MESFRQKTIDFFKFLIELHRHPSQAWNQIAEVPGDDVTPLTIRYLLPMASVPAICHLIGWGLIGKTTHTWGLVTTERSWGIALSMGISTFLASVATVFLVAFTADKLSYSFRSDRNFIQTFRLMVYTLTPVWIGGVFNLVPAISWIGTVVALFSVVLLYTGIPIMKRTHPESRTSYFFVMILGLLVSYNLLFTILKSLLRLILV
jgi:hypothetical protein